MKQKKIQIIFVGILFVILSIILINNISAFAVSSRYYEGNPLYLQPGESAETFFTLQNLANKENITLQARITEGKGIVEITDSSDIYNVPSGEKQKVNLKITVPSDAKKGDKLPVTLMFTTVTISEGPIALGGNIGKGFNVIIGSPEDFNEGGSLKTNFSWVNYAIIALAIGLVCTAVFLSYLIKKRKMKDRGKK